MKHIYITHSELFIQTFPQRKERYENILKRYDNGNCKNCEVNRINSRLERLVKGVMKNEKWDNTELKKVLSDEEFKSLNEPLSQNSRRQKVEPCEECVIKHLSAAFILLNEVQNGNPDNRKELYAELRQAKREGWQVEKVFIKIPLDKLREMIVQGANIDVSEIRFIGYLAIAEEITADAEYKSILRKIRRETQDKIERNKTKQKPKQEQTK